jgi:UDP-N-acetylmuramate--alanine ligase
LVKKIQPHDVLVTIGAGDITKLGKSILDKLKARPGKKKRVGLVFGGRSIEHEISLVSSRNIASGLNREYYDIEYFGISKEGIWLSGEEAESQLLNQDCVTANGPMVSAIVLEKLLACDVLFPVLHGTFGEDGTIQGFFEILGVPYVGPSPCSAAICMDKAITKELMQIHQIPTLDFFTVTSYQWKTSKEATLNAVAAKFSFPLFVKPVHLGSTIGVRRVISSEELIFAVNKAFEVDTKLIIEKAVVGREIEFALLGNENPSVFNPGEVLTKGQVYDYAAKYGAEGIPVAVKADLSPILKEKGKALAKRAYEAVGCKGMARVDFFLDAEGIYWLNEINPIPGFTANSLYPLICEAGGLPLSELLDQLILFGFQHAEQKQMCAIKNPVLA